MDKGDSENKWGTKCTLSWLPLDEATCELYITTYKQSILFETLTNEKKGNAATSLAHARSLQYTGGAFRDEHAFIRRLHLRCEVPRAVGRDASEEPL